MDPKLGGFYRQVFTRVSSVKATGSNQVTIKLKQPDYWLEGELASIPGVVIEKSVVQQQGKNYGTPAGKIMCTGAYELKSFAPGTGVVATANPDYWQGSTKPLVQQITLKGVPDTSTLHLGPADRRDPGLLRRRHRHPGPAGEEHQRQGLPGPGLADRRVHRVQPQGRAG